jgi:hypothetical protein
MMKALASRIIVPMRFQRIPPAAPTSDLLGEE